MEKLTVEQEIDIIIAAALKCRASDIHIDPTPSHLHIAFRIDGKVSAYKDMSMLSHEGIMSRIKVLSRLPLDDRRLPKDGRFKWVGKEGNVSVEIRVSMMPTPYGENAVLRLFDSLISLFFRPWFFRGGYILDSSVSRFFIGPCHDSVSDYNTGYSISEDANGHITLSAESEIDPLLPIKVTR